MTMTLRRFAPTFLAGLAFVLTVPFSSLHAADPAEDVWASGLANLIQEGEFEQARVSLERYLKTEPGNNNYKELATWLDKQTTRDQSRGELHGEYQGQLLELAQRSIAKEEWNNALSLLIDAQETTLIEDEFMRADWVTKLHDDAVALAEKHFSEKKWREATNLYDRLHDLYEGNVVYKERRDECLAHARLDAIYTNDEDSKWESRLRGITRKMVEDGLWRIHASYVEESDFKRFTEAAIKRLMLIAESESMHELFPGLQDENKRAQYTNRLKRRLQRVQEQEDFTYHDALYVFRRVVKINLQTIDLKEELIIYEFMDAGLSALDQFTAMIWPYDFAEFQKQTQGHFTGVGIQISILKGQLTVVSPLEGTPAFRAGIQAEDVLTHVDGESTEGVTLIGAVRKITGPVDTNVTLTVHRPRTDETFDVTLKREEIHIVTVKGFKRQAGSEKWDYMIDPGLRIAYARVTNFADNTVLELKKVLREVKQQGARAFILDLRFNPGGLLRAAIEMSELFLDEDKTIVSTNGLRSERFVKKSDDRGFFSDLPMVVLVNEQSASASEIVSGALKDHKRALIVGERTFGKGSVQNLIPMGNSNAHLKLTTAYYYLPSDRCIHRVDGAEEWGVEPDLIVPVVPREDYRVWSMWRDADIIDVQEGEASSKQVPGSRVPSEDAAAKGAATGTDSSSDSEEPNDSESGKPAESGADASSDESAKDEEAEPEEPPIEFVEFPSVDHQLETAILVLRVQLLKEHGFGILPKVRLGDRGQRLDSNVVTN